MADTRLRPRGRARAANIAVLFAVLSGCVVAFGPAAAAPALPAWRQAAPFSTATASLRVGGDLRIDAEIADTDPLRRRGLGYREGLRPGWGMLFIYPAAADQSFWMKGMRFCLDIIWIQNGEIQGAAESVCPIPGAPDGDLPSYASPGPVTYVLEMPAGWMAAHDFGRGTAVEITLPPTS